MKQTIMEIDRKIERGEAVVMTVQELYDRISGGDGRALEEVDVVTTGTRGIMSGTYAVLSFPISSPGIFERATRVTMNGVPTSVGPCPNERLGILDLMVFGTSVSEHDPKYGGGHLLHDLVAGAPVQVEAETGEGHAIAKEVSMDDMNSAVLMATRHAFRNYRAMVNSGNEAVRTIFHAAELKPHLRELTFSGCGHLNPIQNDPGLRTIGIGTRVLVNGGQGFVTGLGTRSSAGSPNLMMAADMRGMDAELIGGFITSAGPECAVSWAVPIPVLDDDIRSGLARPDDEIPMPVADIKDRHPIAVADYGQVWKDVSATVRVDRASCARCQCCEAERRCPTEAISFPHGKPTIDRYRCYNCGLCSTLCENKVFRADLGEVRFTVDGREVTVPVTCRQSDRVRALRTARTLRDRILDRSFRITEAVGKLTP
ncbi:MAG: methanogenesis marker 16 metalloprotein [Methanomassiliicoccus sp.]|nr:methanogenesis marker 16 metalloprotein [Methanomassiliicoccus sp.]